MPVKSHPRSETPTTRSEPVYYCPSFSDPFRVEVGNIKDLSNLTRKSRKTIGPYSHWRRTSDRLQDSPSPGDQYSLIVARAKSACTAFNTVGRLICRSVSHYCGRRAHAGVRIRANPDVTNRVPVVIHILVKPVRDCVL